LYTSAKHDDVAAKLFPILQKLLDADTEESDDNEALVALEDGDEARNSLGELTLVGMWACGWGGDSGLLIGGGGSSSAALTPEITDTMLDHQDIVLKLIT
jgi:hypothetical protein